MTERKPLDVLPEDLPGATLTDKLTGNVWDLKKLVTKHKEVLIGRVGYDNHIGLGYDVMGGKTAAIDPDLVKAGALAKRVTRDSHAIITYEQGPDGLRYHIKDKSTRGTFIRDPSGMNEQTALRMERRALFNGEEIWFGGPPGERDEEKVKIGYGPVVFTNMEANSKPRTE